MDETQRAWDPSGDGGPGSGMAFRESHPNGSDGFLTLVCLKCGNEYYFAEGEEPESLACDRCDNAVFRSYYTHESEDEAATDFEDTTGRELHTDDAEGDTMPGDVLDLNYD
jgi:hypothetical protein